MLDPNLSQRPPQPGSQSPATTPITTSARSHKHLSRLGRVWIEHPVYFITTCTLKRRQVLASSEMHEICREVWRNCEDLYGWMVGRYVLMPDHVHFFCASHLDAQPLSLFIGKWKEWVTKYGARRHGIGVPLWQEEFFDHLLRSGESYSEKWEYVRMNPVRAGLVADADAWSLQGEMNDLRYD